MPSYDCNSIGLDLGFSIPGDDFFLLTSLYPGLAPLMSRGAAAKYVFSVWNPRHGKDVLGAKAQSFISELRRCPKCWEEYRAEYGTAAYLRAHNMPGVTVCWRHECALERFVGERGRELSQDCFETVEPLPNALEYAGFCRGLLYSNIQCCLRDVMRAVKNSLSDRYDVKNLRACYALPEVTYVTAYGKSFPDVARLLFEKETVRPNPAPVIAFLMFLFNSVENLEKAITTDSPIAAFTEEIREGVELISEYRDTFIRVRCGKCGYEFGSTPHSIVTGLGCPQCLKGISKSQMFARQFAKVGKGYRCLTTIRSMSGPIEIKKIDSGEQGVCNFSYFINSGTYGIDGYVPGLMSCVSNKERHPVIFTDEVIQAEISEMGNFVLEEHRRNHSTHWLTIRHTDCGCVFKIDLTNMRRVPRCRICQMKKKSSTAEKVKKQVAAHVRKDRSHENAMILKRITNGGDFFSNKDFHDIGNPKMVRLRLAELARKGLLQWVYEGIWCKADYHPTPDAVVDWMWIHRDGRRTGFPIGDSLLRSLGCSVDDHVGHFVTSVVGAAAHIYRKKVLGKQFELRRCKVEMTEDNWMVLAVYYTVMFFDEISSGIAPDVVRDVLARWLFENGKREEDFLPYMSLFNEKVAAKVLGFVRSLNTWSGMKE